MKNSETTITGYLHSDYVQSLSEFGSSIHLNNSQGWLLKRKIPGFSWHDATGCYPIFSCRNWRKLHIDLKDIRDDLVSLSVVTDPFGDYDENILQRCFTDRVIPFKEHFIIDLSRPIKTFVSNHHRRYARKALSNVYIEQCDEPLNFLDEWIDLYSVLIEKRNIKGIAVFSRSSFAKQLTVPGIVVFRAVHDETTVGMLLWYVQGKVGYYHLGAYSPLGYELRASFALFWSAIEYFSAIGLNWLSLGAGPGLKSDHRDGLSRFKSGWSTDTRIAYFCGHIFDNLKYSTIVESKKIENTEYFPVYRKGDFG